MLIPDISPIKVGDTGALLAPQFMSKATKKPINLANLTISMKMRNTATEEVKVCAGSWVIDDQINGLAHYQYQANDVSEAGTWEMSITLTNQSGQPVHADSVFVDIEDTF